MGEKENLELAERVWSNWSSTDFTVLGEALADDCIQEWPQSGERIRGKENIIAITENYPGLPTTTVRRMTAGGNLVIGELTLDYGGKIYNGLSILEMAGGKIVREIDYFAEPFEAPAWRAQWVERM